MNSKLRICVLIVQLLEWAPVESIKNIGLSYYYKKQGDVFKPVCENKDEYVVPEGEEIVLYVKKVELLTYAQCTLQQNTSFITANSFQICCESNIYQGKLNHVTSGLYNCSFYVLKEEGLHIEPTAVFNNTVYVRISFIFKLKLYREQPTLLTVEVNGETLIPTRKSIDNVIKSQYKYSKEEQLLVACKKKGSTIGNVELPFPGTNRQVSVPKLPISKAQFQLNKPTLLGPYFTLKCYLNNDNDTLEVYNIDFAPKRSSNEIDVDGLSVNNIIENKDDPKFLYYKYTDIEEINLICSMNCLNKYCLMEMWYNEKKVNFTQWMYNIKIDVSYILLLTPADNSSKIKCVGFHKPVAEILTEYKFITLLHVNNEIKESTTTKRTNGCLSGERAKDVDVNCRNDLPKNREYSIPTSSPETSLTTSPTTLTTTTSQSSTVPDFPKLFIWLIVFALLVLVVLVLFVCLVCKRRRHRRKQKSQRPQLPLPESLELDTFPGASQNQEEYEYEEIPDTVTRSLVPDRRQPDTVTRPGVPERNQSNTVTRPGIPDRRQPDNVTHPAIPDRRQADTVTRSDIPDRRQLRRIPDMRLDPKNGRLIVKGKAIDLQKLLREADYVET